MDQWEKKTELPDHIIPFCFFIFSTHSTRFFVSGMFDNFVEMKKTWIYTPKEKRKKLVIKIVYTPAGTEKRQSTVHFISFHLRNHEERKKQQQQLRAMLK